MFELDKESPTIRRQILRAGLPFKTLGLEFSDLEATPYRKSMERWVADVLAGRVIKSPRSPLCGVGVMLVGEPGHGKTTLASTALQALIRGMSPEVLGLEERLPRMVGSFIDYPKLLRKQQSQFNDFSEDTQLELDSIYGDKSILDNVPVFILDDLGKEYKTSSGWSENQFDALLRSRFNAGLPTIVTTNVPMKSWGAIYGKPMGSFAYEAFIPLDIIAPGGDRRRK